MREQLKRERSLPVLTARKQLHSYSRFDQYDTRPRTGRKEGRHTKSGKRQAHSPKRRPHSVDSDLVSGFQNFLFHCKV